MALKYSRLESTEEKRNFRNAVILVILTLLVIVLLFVYGIPLAGRVASFISGVKDGGNPITSNDTTPPVPPSFNIFPDYTNQNIISIAGTAEPGTSVKLTFNGKDQEVVTDKDGNFIFQGLELISGDNTFWAVAIDTAGNTSQKTATKTINLDTTPPEITLDSPQDGSNLFGNSQRQINIQGTTESNDNLTINDRIVSVDSNGKFQYPVTLNSGPNAFVIKSIDPAGNTTEKSITVNFSD